MTRPEALRLAEWAEWFCRNVSDPEDFRWQHMAAAATELRRLHAENENLKRSVALLQRHHATAWNRGHTMGMKANEDTARRALDAVKQDAWGNTQLTEALLKAEAQRDALLEKIKGALAAERSEGGGCGGFINKPPTREHQRRVAQAWQELHAAIKAVEDGK